MQIKMYLASIRTRIQIVGESLRDGIHFARSAGPEDRAYGGARRARHIEAQLTRDYHRVEKGLALAAPKRPFGAEVQQRLTAMLPMARRYPELASVVAHSESALTALQNWNSFGEVDLLVSPQVSPASVDASKPHSLLERRRSVRDFLPADVDLDALERSARAAGLSPSVCNRQPWGVRFYRGARVSEVLSLQNGNAGFRAQVPCVALVTFDARLYSGPTERRQGFIDGGIFAMGLVLALQEEGLATCMLNLSVSNQKAAHIRSTLGLKPDDELVMMIAIGHATPESRIARSPRRSANEFVVFEG